MFMFQVINDLELGDYVTLSCIIAVALAAELVILLYFVPRLRSVRVSSD